ncbi:hypothetical protein TNCV_3851011 [Trichonephila clavipes]|nr:hypothetical protein TNCV_3851011 [Trichonephila clavipes]
MSQVRIYFQAPVPRYWPKSEERACTGVEGCVPTDMVYNNIYYDPPNILSIAPKKWHVKLLDNGLLYYTCHPLRSSTSLGEYGCHNPEVPY